MSSSIDKTLARVRARIVAREFYEAHQAVRTVVARYVRARDHVAAVGLLYNSALLLAKAQQTGSASDLLLYMLKVYETAQVPPAGPSRGRVAEIAWHLDPRDAVLKQVAQKTLAWAPHDAELAHVFGTLFVRADEPLEAEKYLLEGGRESAQLLGAVHARWAAGERDANMRALFMSRGVLGYLSAGNLRNAHVYADAFAAALADAAGAGPAGPVAEFARLLITTCQTKDARLYRQLADHYKPRSIVPAWEPALQAIEQDFFNIVPQRPFNLMDMMGGLVK